MIDNFPPKAGKSLARTVRPHNEVTISPTQFAVLEQEAFSIVVVLFPYAGTIMLAWGL